MFVVTKGALRTPPADTPVLPGIARGVVMELAKKSGMEMREEPLIIDDLLDADEVFLTNAIMHIMPVIRVEKHDINQGRVGEITKWLLGAYRELVYADCRRIE